MSKKRQLPKKLGRKKLSLYSRTAKYYWRVARTRPLLAKKKDREQKVSYSENLFRLKSVYEKVKELQSQSPTPIFRGNVQHDYSLVLNIYKTKPWETSTDKPLFLLPFPDGQFFDERQIGSNYYDLPFFIRDEMDKSALDTVFEFDCDDSGTVGGRRFTYTTIPGLDGIQIPITGKNLVEVLASSELYWYCKKKEKEIEQFYPRFYIKERRGNDYVKYGMTGFIEGDGSKVGEVAKPKEKKEVVEEEEVTGSVVSSGASENDVKVAEENTRQEQIKLDIKKEETKQKEIDYKRDIIQMFKDKLISKDEMLQLLG